MKITKVNHMKAAVMGAKEVSTSKGSELGGVLYIDPKSKGKSVNIEEHIKEVIKKADKLKKVDRDQSSLEDDVKRYRKSIENQNMIIQPIDLSLNDESLVLLPSIIRQTNDAKTDETRNSKEKEGLRIFLLEYANLNEKSRDEMLRKLRRLLDLYFYGNDEDQVSENRNVWEIHSSRRNNKNSGKVLDVFSAAYSDIDKDGTELSFKKKINLINSSRYRFCRDEINSRYDENDVLKESFKEDELYFTDRYTNLFWLNHIQKAFEKIFHREMKKETECEKVFKESVGYISEKIWKDVLNYICIKYIAIGKAVYHTAMDEVNKADCTVYGEVSKKYIEGITSFDYELIKGEERLQREVAVYVAFAIIHLKNAVYKSVNETEDILTYKKITEYMKDDPLRNILQFFGGKSRWVDALDEIKNTYDNSFISDDAMGITLVDEARDMLRSMRNISFHFDTNVKNPVESKKTGLKLIDTMFEKDVNEYSRVLKNKMYSNNLPAFYKEEDIRRLIDKLYSKVSNRITQIPSFNSIMVRKDFNETLKQMGIVYQSYDTDKISQWQSAVYYAFKEIYYNAFISDSSVGKQFLSVIRNLDKNNNETRYAVNNFQRNIEELVKTCNSDSDEKILSTICQFIMTEYNQQNQKSRYKKTANANDKCKAHYEHFKMLLLKTIRMTFIKYLENNRERYGFLKFPQDYEKGSEEDFIKDYKTDRYSELVKKLSNDCSLKRWYITGRLLNPKQLNQLMGSIRHYLEYKEDVQRRMRQNGITVNNSESTFSKDELKDAIKVLDICTQLSGNTSNVMEDYFSDSQEYYSYVRSFYDDGMDSLNDDIVDEKVTELFKNSGIYSDEKNPIMNKNIVLSKLFCSVESLNDMIKHKVNKADFIKLAKTDIVMDRACCSKSEQEKLKAYQETKNKVELRNIVEYSEIIDEIQGQMVNWSYLRERDLMYFQLGFHYICLNNKSEKPEEYDCIYVRDGEDLRRIKGTVLYQIKALNTYGLPMLDPGKMAENERIIFTKKAQDSMYSSKLGKFCRYSAFKADPSKEETSDKVYKAGLELFENINEHDNIIKLRNAVDHFHYYNSENDSARSIMSMISEIFDRFFTYDIKLRKNIPNVLFSVLLRHFFIARFGFLTGTKLYGDEALDVKKDMALIRINKAASDLFTYKIKDEKGKEKKFKLPARSKEFIENVCYLLYYPESLSSDFEMPVLYDEDTTVNANRNNGRGNYFKKNNAKGNVVNSSKNNDTRYFKKNGKEYAGKNYSSNYGNKAYNRRNQQKDK